MKRDSHKIKLVFSLLNLPSGFFFTTFDTVTAIVLEIASKRKQVANGLHGSPVKHYLERSSEYKSSSKSTLPPLGKKRGPSLEQT